MSHPDYAHDALADLPGVAFSAMRRMIAAPAGIGLHWLARSRGERLVEARLAALPDHAGAKVWFAGERQDAGPPREAAKAAGREASDLRISAFWNAHG